MPTYIWFEPTRIEQENIDFYRSLNPGQTVEFAIADLEDSMGSANEKFQLDKIIKLEYELEETKRALKFVSAAYSEAMDKLECQKEISIERLARVRELETELSEVMVPEVPYSEYVIPNYMKGAEELFRRTNPHLKSGEFRNTDIVIRQNYLDDAAAVIDASLGIDDTEPECDGLDCLCNKE